MGFAALNPSYALGPRARGDERVDIDRQLPSLTFRDYRNIVSKSRPEQGAFHERRETRGGMRWPLWVLRRSIAAEAQAAMIRLTGRGSPAEDTKKVRPAMPVNGVCPPGLSQSKPLTPRAERRRFSAVRGDYLLMRFHTQRMGPWAWLKARRSARPCIVRGRECEMGRRARPRRPKNRDGEALPSFRPPPCPRLPIAA